MNTERSSDTFCVISNRGLLWKIEWEKSEPYRSTLIDESNASGSFCGGENAFKDLKPIFEFLYG